MQFEALASHGALLWADAAKLTAYVERCEGQRLVVTVERVTPLRSLAQNRMIWGTYTRALREFSAFSGHTTKELLSGSAWRKRPSTSSAA